MLVSHETLLWVVLVVLIFISGFFSGSETGMMSLNRYRLRHLAKEGNQRAKRVFLLRQRPDRLLGVILLGNTFANVLAASVATILAGHYFGELGIFFATIALTIVILIFAETTPKTLAALYPLQVSLSVSRVLAFLLKVLYPLVWIINLIANAVLAMCRIQVGAVHKEIFSAAEFKTLLADSGENISSRNQNMLLAILELTDISIAEVMVPRQDVYGIDLTLNWASIEKLLIECPHSHIPIYQGSLNHVVGTINVRTVLATMAGESVGVAYLKKIAKKPYFTPEGAALSEQLFNFQQQQASFGLVVDEYGDVHGIVTLRDVLEEIVGEFSAEHLSEAIKRQKDGGVLVDGSIAIRDLNRQLGLLFPTSGAKTLSGLVIQYLEQIPKPGVGMRIAGYPLEVVSVEGNTIAVLKLWPDLYQKTSQGE